MTKEMLRIGFVGAGSHATTNLYSNLWRAPIDLVAVCDIVEDRAKLNAKRFGGRPYTDAKKMMDEEELDAVFACGLPSMHYEIGMEAISRGLHVFAEKPPAPTAAQALEMAQASAEKGVFVMVAYMKRFARAYRFAKQLMGQEEFGQPVFYEAKYAHWPVGGVSDPFVDQSIYYDVHMFDLMRFFMGDVAEICVQRNQVGGQPAIAVLLKFASGAIGIAHLSSQQPCMQERVDITGQTHNVIVDNVTDLTYRRLDKWEPGNAWVFKPDFAVPDCFNQAGVLMGYTGEIIHFAESVLAGQEPEANIWDGLATMQLAELERQGEMGKALSVPPIMRPGGRRV